MRARVAAQGAQMELPPQLAAELSVRRSTVTPAWWGLWVFIKYRTSRNYQNPVFVAPRVMDKMFIGLLVMTLYLGIGNNLAADNIINITAVLFMWSATTGFVAASYIPSLVVERSLFVRERNDGASPAGPACHACTHVCTHARACAPASQPHGCA